jgi:hypothetical protein
MVQDLESKINDSLDDTAKFILDAEREVLKLVSKPIELGIMSLAYFLEGTVMVLTFPYIFILAHNSHRKLKRLYDANPELYKKFLNERREGNKMPISFHWMTNKEVDNYINQQSTFI